MSANHANDDATRTSFTDLSFEALASLEEVLATRRGVPASRFDDEREADDADEPRRTPPRASAADLAPVTAIRRHG